MNFRLDDIYMIYKKNKSTSYRVNYSSQNIQLHTSKSTWNITNFPRTWLKVEIHYKSSEGMVRNMRFSLENTTSRYQQALENITPHLMQFLKNILELCTLSSKGHDRIDVITNSHSKNMQSEHAGVDNLQPLCQSWPKLGLP